jgi:membrane-bound lytic murein transglycosylase D
MLRQKLYSAGLLISCSLITVSTIQQGPGGKTKIVTANNTIYNDTIIPGTPVVTLPGLDLNQTALQFAKDYVKKNLWDLEELKKGIQSKFRTISSVFSKYSVPPELKYLAVVESNLDTDTACSSAGARGIWQLMPVTASELGLKITDTVDERLQFHKSSAAAAKYLKQLYAEFGDWLLVVAAYNSGPAKVTRAIDLSGTRTFWQLQNFLPAETRYHVKRFVSMLYFFEGQNKANDLVMGRL